MSRKRRPGISAHVEGGIAPAGMGHPPLPEVPRSLVDRALSMAMSREETWIVTDGGHVYPERLDLWPDEKIVYRVDKEGNIERLPHNKKLKRKLLR